MAASIYGLKDFGLDAPSLKRLGDTLLEVKIDLRIVEPKRKLARLPPKERLKWRSLQWRSTLERFRQKVPMEKLKVSGRRYSLIQCLLPAKGLARVAALQEVRSIWLERVPGRRRRRRKAELRWFAVRGLVAVQVENERRGLQLLDDAIIMVKAKSKAEAMRRATRVWDAYEVPYGCINLRGEMVRWWLEAIEDVYECSIYKDEIDPSGTEVYSRLSRRRMRPEHVWRVPYRR